MIGPIEFALNNQVQQDTGRTPFELSEGQHPLDPISLYLDSDNDAVLQNWSKAVTEAVELYSAVQRKRIERINSHRLPHPFKVGDKVLLTTKYMTWYEAKVLGKKLKPRWNGPYTITKFTKRNQAAFLDFDNHQINIHPVQSVDRLEPYYPDSYQGNDSRCRPPPEPKMIEGELYYEVAKIIDRRYVRNRYEYRVQWVGFETRQAQWLTENWIRDTCKDLIIEYDEANPRQEPQREQRSDQVPLRITQQ